MKNSELIVKGQKVQDLDLKSFTKAEDMTSWELDANDGAYAAYDHLHNGGDGVEAACNRDQIEELSDLFGTEFAETFYGRRAQLNAQSALEPLTREISRLTRLRDHALGRVADLAPRQMPTDESLDRIIASWAVGEPE